jgi:hypothetical protein
MATDRGRRAVGEHWRHFRTEMKQSSLAQNVVRHVFDSMVALRSISNIPWGASFCNLNSIL